MSDPVNLARLSKPQRAAMQGLSPYRIVETMVRGERRLALLLPPDMWKTRNALHARGLVTGRSHQHDGSDLERVLLTPLGEQVYQRLTSGVKGVTDGV